MALFSEFGRFGVDPFAEMRRMQREINRMFEDFSPAAVGFGEDFPPVNMWVGDGSVALTVLLPGLSPEEVDVTVQEDVLTLRAKRELPPQDGEVTWHRRERFSGTFARTVQLPFRVDPDKVRARFTNGVLEIEMERPESDRPKRIQIRAS